MKRLIGCVLVAAALAGCQASSGGGAGGGGDLIKVNLAPNVQDYRVQRAAVLGFANTSAVREADEMYTFVLQALAGSGKAVITTAEALADEARRTGTVGDHERLLSTWQKRRIVEDVIAARFLEATGIDALIALEFTKWEEQKLAPTQEGTSNTTVGLRMEMYGRDGTLLWSASTLKVAKSISYNPDFNLRSTQAGEARTTSTTAVPDPPKIRVVAQEVAREVVATMPDLRGDAGAMTP